MPVLTIIFGFLFAAALRIVFLLAATWLLVTCVPQVLADPDHFSGWLGILVALSITLAPTQFSTSK